MSSTTLKSSPIPTTPRPPSSPWGFLLFESLWEAKPAGFDKDGPLKHTVKIAFTDQAMQTPEGLLMQSLARDAARDRWGPDVSGMSIRWPFNADFDPGKVPHGTIVVVSFKSNADHPPGIFGPNREKDLDRKEIYKGVLCRVTYRPFAYGARGQQITPGVSLGLGDFQKLQDAPRLAAGGGDGSDFAPWEPLPNYGNAPGALTFGENDADDAFE